MYAFVFYTIDHDDITAVKIYTGLTFQVKARALGRLGPGH